MKTRELVLDGALADEVLERARAQRAVELLLGADGGARPAAARRRACGCPRVIAPPSARRRSAPRPTRRRPRRAATSASCALKPRPRGPGARACAGRRTCVIDDLVADAAGDLLAQLDDDALGGALADAGHRLEPRRVAGRDRVQELARRAAREHRERDLRARRPGRRSASGTARAPPRSRSRTGASRRRA